MEDKYKCGKEDGFEEEKGIYRKTEEIKEMIEKCKKASILEIAEMVEKIESYDEEGKKIIKDEFNKRNKMSKMEKNIEECSVSIEKNRKKRLYYFIIMCSIFYISAILMIGIEETFEMLFTGRNIRMILLFSVLADIIYIKKNKLKGKDAQNEMSKIRIILLAVATLLLPNDFSIFGMD